MNINAVANRQDAKVEIIGNENIHEGENRIIIKLTADGEEDTVYEINVNNIQSSKWKENVFIICLTGLVLGVIWCFYVILLKK